MTHSGSVVDTYQLPAANWTRGRGSYAYKDATGGSGPCRSITAKMGSQLRMRCNASGLNVPSTAMNEVAIRLELGAEKTARRASRGPGGQV